MEQRQAFNTAVDAVLKAFNGKFSLKTEQRAALEVFIERKDVFALLLTGFGKSLIYQLAPLVAKSMGLSENPIVVVVSPLIALMENQVREATALGISAAQLDPDNEALIKRGSFNIVFGSLESWLSGKWRDMLADEVYKENLLGIVVDEVHLTYKWGRASKGRTAVRESFSRLGELHSIVKPGTPVMALTASADLQSRAIVTRQLHMDNATTLTVSPNRQNIRLGLHQLLNRLPRLPGLGRKGCEREAC
ncbi:putative ATP-dependent DNA helicase Q1 [Neoarius graeffei]|uniref:putative ATP-dependent DNA helicase Q1 n=1 Tax=Neoarius graeffei TaxID=443677 RepID=UPI00298C3047|nr:putative ATP-dependent DNA helicase Q1 [Neoarius graeffei]